MPCFAQGCGEAAADQTAAQRIERLREMTETRRTVGTRTALPLWLVAGLTPLLLALWGGQVQAVTVEATGALRSARRCVDALQGMPGTPGLLTDDATLRLVVPGACAPRHGYAAVPWAEPDLSQDAILRLSRALRDPEVTDPRAPRFTDERGAHSAVADVAEPTVLLGSRGGEVAAAELLKPVTYLRPYAPRWRDADAEATERAAAGLAWWHGLPLVPGLVAVIASVRGLVLTRRRRYPLG